jgi:Fur family ferric uptake transcriptional regulator
MRHLGTSDSEELAILEGYLKEKGLRMTPTREAVLGVFLSIEGHVTAEALFEEARKREPGIGQATVFRTIKLLVGAGLAREACSGQDGTSYEHAFHHAHHDHLVCLGCGRIIEFKDPSIERAQEAIYRKHGFSPSGHHLRLEGYCPGCVKKGR